MEGEEEELSVACNDEDQSVDWVAESLGGRRIVEGDPELIVPGGTTRFGTGNTLFPESYPRTGRGLLLRWSYFEDPAHI